MQQTNEAQAGVLRNTNDYYNSGNPLDHVDRSIVEEIVGNCGKSLLDLGCGVGGYAKTLVDAGYTVQAMDINPAYVQRATELGVSAVQYDGITIPLPDNSVDTVFMIEVLEHVPLPQVVIDEAFRVSRKNVIITVPNNTQRLCNAIVWSHMLDMDHKNFFTDKSLLELLKARFRSVVVRQIAMADYEIARTILSKGAFLLYRIARKLGLEKEKMSFRLIAIAQK